MTYIFKKLYEKFFSKETQLPPGETEFDYIPLQPKKETKVKTKITKVQKVATKPLDYHEIY